MLLTSGFTASNSYLDKLMFNQMQLRVRVIRTRQIAASFRDELEAKKRLLLLRLAWLVWHCAIPPALVASRDQFGVLIFPRCRQRHTDQGSQQVPGIEADDKEGHYN